MQLCYEHVRAFADGVILVSDDELRAAMRALFALGLVCRAGSTCILAGHAPLIPAAALLHSRRIHPCGAGCRSVGRGGSGGTDGGEGC
jgi:threonine dehydratase